MENQVILAASIEGGKPYFSVWTFGKRVIAGSRSPYTTLKHRKNNPYKHKKLNKTDFPLLLQPLIQWSE
ncbi:hypothetical protein EKK58_08085 [Candidatus Dependentiae bacterium]|nr:MAG: hypothetical protein EKK58_08085 [Candidatus Dependentiae bacterium]